MTDLANNKGKAISDEEMSKASGGYIVSGGLFHKDKVYDSKGKLLGKDYFAPDALLRAERERVSDMYISEDELKQLKTKGYFTRGNRKYHDDTWEYL